MRWLLGTAMLCLALPALPAQAAECAPRRSMPHHPLVVFFDPGSADITPRGALMLGDLVELVRLSDTPSEPFVVMGATTDAAEDADPVAARDLRFRRGEAVRSYLLAAGIGPRWLFVDASGSRPRYIPTAPGVSELQNRMVEILPRIGLRTPEGC